MHILHAKKNTYNFKSNVMCRVYASHYFFFKLFKAKNKRICFCPTLTASPTSIIQL